MQFADSLFSLRGRIQSSRPNLPGDFATNALNDRLHQILDNRTFWADLLTFGILSIPAPQGSWSLPGTSVSVTTGSPTVTGSGTAWPVSDVVNTIIPDGVAEYGYVEVTPASMQGITANSMLCVDWGLGAPTAEIVPVVQVDRTSFIAKFTQQHGPGCTVTQSSLATLQFRVSEEYPVFHIAAVTSPTSLVLTLPWGGPSMTGQTWTIKLMYIVLATDLKSLINMKDEQTGFPVRIHRPTDEADFRDPQRSLVTGQPWYSLLDVGSNAQGNMLYEMWPAPSDARQFSYAYWRQWQDMVKDTDRPPSFINPSILYYGALADAKMYRGSKDDQYYDPEGARYYVAKFEQGLQEAKNADEAKRLEALRDPYWKNTMQGNYNSWQLSDPSCMGFWSEGY